MLTCSATSISSEDEMSLLFRSCFCSSSACCLLVTLFMVVLVTLSVVVLVALSMVELVPISSWSSYSSSDGLGARVPSGRCSPDTELKERSGMWMSWAAIRGATSSRVRDYERMLCQNFLCIGELPLFTETQKDTNPRISP